MGIDNIILPILQRRYWRTQWALALWLIAGHTFAASILFIGNSFTFAYGSPVRYYRPDSVTDLNSAGQGGVAALFKSFTAQTGLSYDVYLETEPGVGIDWHLEPKRPGDPTLLMANVRQMAQFLRSKNAKADVRIMATWPRAAWVRAMLRTGPLGHTSRRASAGGV